MSMDDLSMQGYLGNQIGNSQYNTTIQQEMERQQRNAYFRQQAQLAQNAAMLGQFQQQEVQRTAIQPQKSTDDHLLVLLTEE